MTSRSMTAGQVVDRGLGRVRSPPLSTKLSLIRDDRLHAEERAAARLLRNWPPFFRYSSGGGPSRHRPCGPQACGDAVGGNALGGEFRADLPHRHGARRHGSPVAASPGQRRREQQGTVTQTMASAPPAKVASNTSLRGRRCPAHMHFQNASVDSPRRRGPQSSPWAGSTVTPACRIEAGETVDDGDTTGGAPSPAQRDVLHDLLADGLRLGRSPPASVERDQARQQGAPRARSRASGTSAIPSRMVREQKSSSAPGLRRE